MAIDNDLQGKPSLFQLASARMEWLSKRQELVAKNIANADTPGYRAQELTSFDDYLSTGTAEVREAQNGWDFSPDGNRVVLEEQTLIANEIEGNHRMAAQLYRKGHDLIGLAVGKSR